MAHKLTVTTGVVLALVLAGCGGKDGPSKTTAQSAATAPAATTTTPAASSSPPKTTGSKTSASKTSSAAKTTGTTSAAVTAAKKAAALKKSAALKKAAAAKKAAAKKPVTTPKKPVGVTPASGPASTADPSTDGSGSGPTAERLQVVATLRRYYKAFLDRNGADACSLLTSAGQDIMVKDGGAKTCDASVVKLIGKAGAGNLDLLKTTRDGLHVDDITITGNNATAQIGATSRLRLVRENGRWLLRSPDVVNGNGP